MEGGCGGRPAGCRGILQALPSSIPHSREVAGARRLPGVAPLPGKPGT